MRILYVEDHPDTAAAMRRILERKGHQVTIASTAREAKYLCVDHVYDLWILDLGLPDAHGGNLLRFLRRLTDTKAIALTGHGSPQDVQEGRDDGFDEYLVKPVDVNKLLEALARLAPEEWPTDSNSSLGGEPFAGT